MPASELSVKLTGDEANLFLKMRKIIDAQTQMENGFQGVGAKGRKMSDDLKARLDVAGISVREFNKLQRDTGKIIDKNKTPVQRYKEELRKLNVMMAATGQHTGELAEAKDRLKQKIKQAGRAQRGAFGQEALDHVKRFAGTIIGMVGSVQLVRMAWRQVSEERDRAMGQTETLDDARRRLAQISQGNLTALESKADSAVSEGFTGVSREQSMRVLFSAISEGWIDSFEDVIRRNPVISVEAGARIAGQIRNLFGDQFSVAQVTEMVLAGAKSSRLDVEGISSNLPAVAASAGLPNVGTDAAEQIATLSVLADKFKSGETAAFRISAFAAAVNVRGGDFEGVQGVGLVDAAKAISEMSSEDRKTFLKDSKELREAYGAILRNSDEIVKRESLIVSAKERAGTDKAGTELALAERLADPASKAFYEKQREQIKKEIAEEEKLSKKAFQTETIINAQASASLKAGGLPTERIFGRTFGKVAEFMGDDVDRLTRLGETVGGAGVSSSSLREHLDVKLSKDIAKLTPGPRSIAASEDFKIFRDKLGTPEEIEAARMRLVEAMERNAAAQENQRPEPVRVRPGEDQ